MSKKGIAVKGTMDFNSVVSFLEDVVKSFKEGKVVVQRGEEFVTLTPAENMEVEVEAAEKKGKQKLSIELEWRAEVELAGAVPFKVSADEPELPEPELPEPELPEPEAPAQDAGAEPKVAVTLCKSDAQKEENKEELKPAAKAEPKAPVKADDKAPAKDDKTKAPAKK